MQTVNFQCGHCGNLMAVGADHLGQQVRCPHCQQVVVAPPPAPAPAAPEPGDTTFQPTVPQDHEDIFAPPAPTEDLFDAPHLPKLEIPPPLNGPPPEPALTQPSTLAYEPGTDATLPFMSGAAPPPGEATLPLGSAPPGPNWMEPTLTDAPAGPVAGAPATDLLAAPEAPAGEDLAAAIPRPVRRPSGGGGWFIPVIFIPLLVYAVLVTITAVVFWNRLQQTPPSPFDAMPDVDGDNPGVKKGKAGARLDYDRKLTTDPLPAHLHVALGKTLRVGDLEITPEQVERRRVAVVVEGFKPEPCPGDSLVLHLRLHNLAADYAFTPLDDFFDRCWRPPAG
ncbi:MAG TPA: hypothetical protein VFE78_34935, partial [Gemmataceae bacterium]|nr:hypothetical protein [Gemmataceae bacterium]